MDRAGRVVIPKAVRDWAGLEAGDEIDVAFRDGRIELEPVRTPMHLTGCGVNALVGAGIAMPVLTAEDVRDVLDRTRR
jgi:AbrB family looped-hinge helix DNA binding protein